MKCRECIDSMYPENPNQSFFTDQGRLPSLCTYCASSDNGHPILDKPVVAPSEQGKAQKSQNQQVTGRMNYLQRQIDEIRPKKKKGAEIEIEANVTKVTAKLPNGLKVS